MSGSYISSPPSASMASSGTALPLLCTPLGTSMSRMCHFSQNNPKYFRKISASLNFETIIIVDTNFGVL
jgi:hypothetical protein